MCGGGVGGAGVGAEDYGAEGADFEGARGLEVFEFEEDSAAGGLVLVVDWSGSRRIDEDLPSCSF